MFGIFPEDDYQQTLRLKRFLMAFASYLMWSIIALFAFLMGIIPGQYTILIGYLSGIILCNIFIYTLIRTGFNKRFKDPSLTLLQMVIATFWIMVFAYYAGPVRSVVLLVYLITFVFGLFRLNVWQYLFLSVFAVFNYAVVILLLYINHPESVNGNIDVLNLIVLAMVLPWFSMVGGYITRLRAKVAKSLFTIKETEAKFRTIFDFASDGILLVKISDRKFISANKKMCEMLGYTFDEILNLIVSDIHPKESIPYINDKFNKLMEKEISVAQNIPLLKKDKTIFLVDISASLMTFDKKECLVGIFRDITEHKLLEEKLRYEGQRFRAFIEHSSDIITILNRDGIITYINPAIEQVMGFKPEERIGAKGFELVHPDDIKFLAESFITLVSNPKAPAVYYETRLRHKNGSYRICEGVGSNFVNNNIVEAIIVNYRDITERKKSEEWLKQSEEKYRLLADHMKDQVWLMDLDLNTTYISPSVERAL